MRIYLFLDEETGSLFTIPWTKKEPPVIVEAKIRRNQNDEEPGQQEDENKPN